MNISNKFRDLHFFGERNVSDKAISVIRNIVDGLDDIGSPRRILNIIEDVEYFSHVYELDLDDHTQKLIDLAAYKASLAIEKGNT